MASLINTFIVIALLFGIKAYAEDCVPSTLNQVHRLTESLKQRKFIIHDLTSLMITSNREAIREYYKLGQLCPSQEIVKQISDDLIEFGYPLQYLPGLFGKSLTEVGLRLYQIGDSWDRQPVKSLSRLSKSASAAYSSTAIGGLIREVDTSGQPKLKLYSVGTGFLIRTRLNKYVIATALHVFEDNAKGLKPEKACEEMVWHFPSGEKVYFNGKKLLLKSSALDLALCEIEVPETYREFMNARGLELEQDVVPKGTPFVTVGFGVYGNEKPGQAFIEQSRDCRSFLPGDLASLRDGKWSLPTGCDASPADSGSAVVNSLTGKVAGILWGTTMVKRLISSQELSSLAQQESDYETLWSELSLMIPAFKIAEELKKANLLL